MIIEMTFGDKGKTQFSVDDFEVIPGIGVVFYVKQSRTLYPFTSFRTISWKEENSDGGILPEKKLYGF